MNYPKTSRVSLNERVCTVSLRVGMGSEGQVVHWDAQDVYETATVLVAVVGERSELMTRYEVLEH